MQRTVVIAAASAVASFMSGLAIGAPATWSQTAAGTHNWNDNANWTAAFPNAVGDNVVNWSNMAGAQTVNLNAAITIGGANLFGDTSGNSGALTIEGNGGSLVFDSTGTASVTTTIQSTNLVTFNTDIALNDAWVLSGDGTSSAFSGSISGAQTLNKGGTGTARFTGANSFSGLLTVSRGTLIINKLGNGGDIDSNVGSNSSISLVPSGTSSAQAVTLQYEGTGETSNRGITTGSNQSSTIVQNGASGNLKLTANITIAPTANSGGIASRALILSGSTAATGEIAGNLTGTSGNLTKNGTGLWTLSGTNTYTGATLVNNGVLRVGASGLSSGNLQIGNSAGVAGVLELAGGNFARDFGTSTSQIRFLSGGAGGGFSAKNADRTVNLNASANLVWGSTTHWLGAGQSLLLSSPFSDAKVDFQNPVDLNSASRTVNVANGSASVDAEMSGVISSAGSGSLTKTGLGTLELTNANTYAGGTTVTAGTLLVNNVTGSGTGSGAVLVDAGAVLGGDGSIDGAVTVNGEMSPGSSPGVLSVNNTVALGNASRLRVELNGVTAGSQYDQLAVNNTVGTGLTIGSDVDLAISLGFVPAVNDFFAIVTNNDNSPLDAVVGTFGSVNGVAMPLIDGSSFTVGVTTFRIDYDGVASSGAQVGGNDLILTVVPEPGVLSLLASAWVIFRRRRAC